MQKNTKSTIKYSRNYLKETCTFDALRATFAVDHFEFMILKRSAKQLKISVNYKLQNIKQQ